MTIRVSVTIWVMCDYSGNFKDSPYLNSHILARTKKGCDYLGKCDYFELRQYVEFRPLPFLHNLLKTFHLGLQLDFSA